jgi:hypothetical protein
MLILATEYEHLITLPETCRVAHAHTGDVAIIIDKIPLAGIEVESKHVIIDFVRVLVESAKRVDFVVANIRDRCEHEYGRSLPHSTDDFWPVLVRASASVGMWAGRQEIRLLSASFGNGRRGHCFKGMETRQKHQDPGSGKWASFECCWMAKGGLMLAHLGEAPCLSVQSESSGCSASSATR